MTKKEFIEIFQLKGKFKKKTEAENALRAFIESIEEVLIKDDEISFLGFGKFEVVERAARIGRNPSTGEEIKIAARKVVKFKPGKALDEKLN